MNDSIAGRENGHDDRIDVEKRTRRALEQPLSVLSVDGTPIDDADTTIVSVVSHSGEQYTVDVRDGRCTCPDAEYNLDDDEACKHEIRARAVLRREPVNARVFDAVDVDPQLGQHAFEPAVTAADGGIVDGGDDAVVLDDDTDSDGERPADCDCVEFHADAALPCWPCYRDGFDEPATVDTDGVDAREEPTRSEPADFGGGESTGVQEL